MKKEKHLIETIDDIKYCEENGLIIFSDKICSSWEFLNNVWCQCVGKFVCLYNVTLNIKEDKLFYYEEQEQQEAQQSDIGKLCWFFYEEDKGEKIISILRKIEPYDYGIGVFMTSTKSYYPHCRPLTKEEIKEFMEKAE